MNHLGDILSTRGRRCGAGAHTPGRGGSTPPPATPSGWCDSLLAALPMLGTIFAWALVLALLVV